MYGLVIVRITGNIRSTAYKRSTTRGYNLIQVPVVLNNKFMKGSLFDTMASRKMDEREELAEA